MDRFQKILCNLVVFTTVLAVGFIFLSFLVLNDGLTAQGILELSGPVLEGQSDIPGWVEEPGLELGESVISNRLVMEQTIIPEYWDLLTSKFAPLIVKNEDDCDLLDTEDTMDKEPVLLGSIAVPFAVNSKTLSANMKEVLVAFMAEFEGMEITMILLEGHTAKSSSVSDANALKFSLERAVCVEQLLISYGYNADMLQVVGLGNAIGLSESMRLAGEWTNRRTEIFVFGILQDKPDEHDFGFSE